MRDIARFKGAIPAAAEGRIRLDFTDPITGRIKNQIEGKNHVFLDALFAGTNYNWVSTVSAAWMVLNDSSENIDKDIPYMLGQTVGYGIPNQGTKGTVRGAYNATNQVLAAMTTTSVRWKFQYDFTIAQANGIPIRTVGLTHQYGNFQKLSITGFQLPAPPSWTSATTTDGRHCYTCSAAGIITKYDLVLGTSADIDVSSVVGTTSSNYKHVGYAPKTGKFYIYVYSGTTSARRMYAFSDGTFASLLETYFPSNVAISFGASTFPMYIYEDYAFSFMNNAGRILKADFVTNRAAVEIIFTAQNAAMQNEANRSAAYLQNATIPWKSKYVLAGAAGSVNACVRTLVDLENDTFVAEAYMQGGAQNTQSINHPLAQDGMHYLLRGEDFYSNTAIAAYKLPEPITKTSAEGMTATYEIEVFWE